MKKWPVLDLVAACVIASAALASSFALAVGNPIRVGLTLPLVLLLPGYSIMAAAYPQRPIGAVSRASLSVGISIASTALLGLLMNTVGLDLQPRNWALGLFCLTAGGAMVAAIRGFRTTDSAVAVPALKPALATLPAIAIASAAVALSSAGAADHPHRGFTELSTYPSARASSRRPIWTLRVVSHESAPVSYRLVVQVGRRRMVRRFHWLRPGADRRIHIVLPRSSSGASRATARLYRGNAKRVYRHISLLAGDLSAK